MPRSKLLKIKDLGLWPQVIQYSEANGPAKLRSIISNYQETVLELGCGRGDYTLALAKQKPDALCIGIDIQGERLWYGARQSYAEKLNNVFWLRLLIEKLDQYFPTQSVTAIWLTFPDPYPKKRQVKHRLTAPYFLAIYQKLLSPSGRLYLKTDDLKLFDYSLENIRTGGGQIIQTVNNLKISPTDNSPAQIQTHFEKKHRAQGKKIHFLSAQW